MAKIISFANQKGGVGKSQCTQMTAQAFASFPFNLKVLVVDIDKQQSIYRAREIDKQAYQNDLPLPYFDVVSLSSQDFVKQLSNLDENYDLIFVDIAGKMDNNLPKSAQEVTPVLAVCDILIVPFLSGNYNFNSSTEFVDFAWQVKELRKDTSNPLSIAVFGNRISKDTLSSLMLNEMWALKEMFNGLIVFKTCLRDSNSFKSCDTVTSMYMRSKTVASQNFTQFFNELKEKFSL